jgi:hypothetical protein
MILLINKPAVMAALYFKIESYEAGIAATGRRSSSYHCYCEIYDENKNAIKRHALSDVFYGKWRKCSAVINKWQKAVDKAKLQKLN